MFDVATELVAGGALRRCDVRARPRPRSAARALVELVGLVGYYTMVAMTLNAFEVPAPDGAPGLPPTAGAEPRRGYQSDDFIRAIAISTWPSSASTRSASAMVCASASG